MALHGHPEPNFDMIMVGATNEDVELEFGKAVSSRLLESGNREDTFKYEMANSPNPGRATMYGYIDLVTIGLAEPILTLVELFQAHDEETTVIYNNDNRVIDIIGYRPPAPSPALATAEESQRRHTTSSSQKNGLNKDRSENPALAIDSKVQELAHRLSTSLKDHKIVRVAVLPVQDALGNESQAFGNYLTEKLTAKLHEENVARVVERSQLTRVTQELSLTHSGSFDEESAMRIGNLLGVEALVTTLYADLGHSSIEINSKVVRVETGEILGVGTTTLPRVAVDRMLPQ